MKVAASLLALVIGVLLAIPMMLTWERPPMDSAQLGPRGLGMEQITNPRLAEDLKALNTSPAPDDPVDNDGVLVKDQPDVYQNIQVLGDLDTAQFTRLMNAITNLGGADRKATMPDAPIATTWRTWPRTRSIPRSWHAACCR